MTTEVAETGSGFHADPEAGVCYRTLDFVGLPGVRAGDDGSVWTRWCNTDRRGQGAVGAWRRLMPYVLRNGYLRVSPSRGGKQVRFLLHRLILQCFVGPCPDAHECRHLDGNKANNALANLAWGTRSQNAFDRVAHGTLPVGEECALSRLTADAVRQIRRTYDAKEANLVGLAVAYGVTKQNIFQIVKRKTWKHLTP